jgi:hypothetical protein
MKWTSSADTAVSTSAVGRRLMEAGLPLKIAARLGSAVPTYKRQ